MEIFKFQLHGLPCLGILLERDRKGDVGKNYDRFVSIQSLHTEGDLIHTNVTVCFDISIHFLHTERDLARAGFHAPKVYISIHSLHTEGDDLPASLPFLHRHFNPLPPYGGRRITDGTTHIIHGFSIHSLHTGTDRTQRCQTRTRKMAGSACHVDRRRCRRNH